MKDYENYDSYPEDRILLENDMANGPGVTASLLKSILDKHGWTLLQMGQWFSKGRITVDNPPSSYEIIVHHNIKKVENN